MDIKHLDKDELSEVLSIIPWNLISEFLVRNTKLYKRYVSGSFQVSKKNISRFSSIMKNFGTEGDFRSLFSQWYDHEKNYKCMLEPYFKSKEYSEYKTDKEVADGKYILEKTKFEELCQLLTSRHAKIFRCMSPIDFDADQMLKLNEIEAKGASGSGATVDPDLAPKNNIINPDDLAKMKGINKELKILKEKYKSIEERYQKLENDNLKYKTKIAKKNMYIKVLENSKIDYELKCGSELQKKVEEVNDITMKLNEISKQLVRSDGEIKNKSNQIDKLKKKITSLETRNDESISAILLKLDIDKLVAYLNTPNEINECLKSVVKQPVSDDNLFENNSSAGFDNLYDVLNCKENQLINSVVKTNISDVISNQYLSSWADRSDEFYNLRCILSAKLFMVNTLYEILRQYFVAQTSLSDNILANQ